MPTMKRTVVVIGGGIVGCGAALAMARRGWNVRVVEQNEAVGQGSTARSSTVVRCHYTRPEAIRLAVEGRSVWQGWSRFLGTEQPLARYEQTGVLFLLRRALTSGTGPDSLGMKAEMDARAIDARVQMMQYAGVDAELLSARRLRKRFPSLHFPEEDVVGVWEPESGYVAYPTEAVKDLAVAARREGVEISCSTRLTGSRAEWTKEGRVLREVRVQREGVEECWPVDAVINCAGPQSHQVNMTINCPLPHTTAPQRQFVVEGTWANPTHEPLPAMADLAHGFYIRPDPVAFKIGAVLPEDHVDFSSPPGSPVSAEEKMRAQKHFLERMKQRLPAVQLSEVTVQVGYYDWTVSDSYPLIGETDLGGYFVAIGTSGAWFKSGPVIGALIATRIHRTFDGDERTLVTLPLSGLKIDLARFSPRRALAQ